MTDRSDTPAYELQDVSKTYELGAREVHAVREINLTIAAGEFVAVAGPSGSGKTTLLQLLGALDRPTSGGILFEGRDIARLGDGELGRLRLHSFGFVFQQFNLIPTLTAAQNIEIALAPSGMRAEDRGSRVVTLLEAVGLAGRADHVPGQLSGGEQQRVAIARSLANEPHVLLADEPTGNLDSTTGSEILDLLLSLSGDGGRTVIIVTHDPDVAGRAERVLRMHDGRLLPSAEEVGVASSENVFRTS